MELLIPDIIYTIPNINNIPLEYRLDFGLLLLKWPQLFTENCENNNINFKKDGWLKGRTVRRVLLQYSVYY